MLSKSLKMLALHFLLCIAFISVSSAQTDAEIKEALVKGMLLVEQGQLAEAVPYLEILVKTTPDEPKLRFIYGAALLTKSKQIDNTEEAKQLSAKALEEFKTAKKLGLNDPRNEAFISILSGGGNNGSTANTNRYSKNAEAEKLMSQAETNFAQSKYDEALKFYEKALTLDPNIYEAALFSGDVYVTKKDWENAEKSYQKAIAINPTRETAYRYSATPFMKQNKYDQARDRYIEAFITEPYSDLSPRGISQWAQITGAKLGHPKIDVPQIKYDASGKATTVMNENSLTEGSKYWLAYSLTRENWHKEKFAKTFPGERQYRHSLQEETEAIRSAIKSAKEAKSTDAKFAILEKIDNDGLLESYILLAIPDDGIAEDHPVYLKTNREKLRQYVLKYVISSGK
jgi:tetratricopeptide (TPR) repeat protein